jgi:hypothetical protein
MGHPACIMLALLPLACFLVCLAASHHATGDGWRRSFLNAALAWGVLVTASTELLSVVDALTTPAILLVWVAGLGAATVGLFYLRRKRCLDRPSTSSTAATSLSAIDSSMLAGVCAVAVAVGVVALLASPNTWDSMTYHLSRVEHWVQNESVGHYPTHILRQLHQNPWAEYAITHLRLLSGGDTFAALVQWFSLIGSAVGGSLIAQGLGANTRGQVLAAVVSITIPMGVLQGSSTQNDYVVAFWLVAFAFCTLKLLTEGRRTDSVAAGVALGLAVLTKGTAYVVALPFVIWAIVAAVRTRRRVAVVHVITMVLIAFVLNAGHYLRNQELYDHPLGPGQEDRPEFKYAADLWSPAAAASGVIRNLGLHLATPSERFNSSAEAAIIVLHGLIGIDASDTRTTWGGVTFGIPEFSKNEDTTGNSLHVVIGIAAALLVAFRVPRDRRLETFALCTLCAGLMFSVLLRWQPWHSRLHLPLFVLWSPVIAVTVATARSRVLAPLVAAALLIAAVPYVIENRSRPLIGDRSIFVRSGVDQYFANRPELLVPYRSAVQTVRNAGCTDVGLAFSGGDDWEYPFWVLSRNPAGAPQRFHHVNVSNVSGTLEPEPGSAAPCAVISVNYPDGEAIQVGPTTFRPAWQQRPVQVYLPK